MENVAGIPLLQKLNNYGKNGLNRKIRGTEIQKLLTGYKNLIEFMPSTDSDAILEPVSAQRDPISHRKLKEFVTEFDLSSFGIKPSARVGVLLPNGPELAVTLVCVVSQWCAAPINLTNTWEEIKSELLSTKCVAIVIMTGANGNEAALRAAEELNIGVITLTSLGTTTGLFRTKLLRSVQADTGAVAVQDIHQLGTKRTVLLLHTSGTSGNKKLVPYSLDTLMVGVGCIVSSWALQPTDVCLNMMPLFHIGTCVSLFERHCVCIASGGHFSRTR